ncbi:peroxidase [Rhodococcus hoagii]|nr:peroxidase [Prescottella equi]
METTPQAHATFVGLDLRSRHRPGRPRAADAVWTDDAARLTEGRGALADTEPDLATAPARLTVTVGFGPGAFRAAAVEDKRPSWCKPVPPFEIDKLEDRWNGGDLLLHVGSDDPVTVAHALRVLLKAARGTATVRWSSAGSGGPGAANPRHHDAEPQGQVDGTVNRRPAATTSRKWCGTTAPSSRGSRWDVGGDPADPPRPGRVDELDRPGRDEVMGRRMSDGAPLTGESEHDAPDFDATGRGGLKIIPEFSHIARARPMAPRERFHRRAYNYDEAPDGIGVSDSGLIFVAYQADVDAQYLPVQQRLARPTCSTSGRRRSARRCSRSSRGAGRASTWGRVCSPRRLRRPCAFLVVPATEKAHGREAPTPPSARHRPCASAGCAAWCPASDGRG